MSERIACINPHCRRTFKAEEHSSEVICRKCFRSLPEHVRKEHRSYWREIRMWDRRSKRTGDELRITKMIALRDRVSFRLGRHWDTVIKPFFTQPEKPMGLESFLEDVGL